jgi:UDP-N-acetylmuramate--alanine ligase
MDLSRIKKVYMIGIKGVGMAMLGQYLAGQGIEVIGSDVADDFATTRETLANSGITVRSGFDPANIPDDADLIIYSSAYNPEKNTEVGAALAGKTRTMVYAEALGKVFGQKFGIAVCGSHGKTTTTAWLGYVLDRSGLEPSVLVGTYVPQFSGGALVGRSDHLIVEADEYQNKLSFFDPKAVLLNNIDYDHPDFFPTEDDYIRVFIEFIKKIPPKGFLVANFDDPIIRKVANVNSRCKVISYSLDEPADYVAYDIRQSGADQFFKVKLGVDETDDGDDIGQSDLGDFKIKLAGRHNIYNALAVIAASIELGVDLVSLRTHLSEFAGTARRMQIMGNFRGATIIDDYAHHPTEIRSTLEGIRAQYGGNRLIVVFHPHTFSRTKALLGQFAQSFQNADTVVVLDIFGSAREEQGGVHSRELVEGIIATNRNRGNDDQKVEYIATLTEAEEYLRKNIERNDVVVLMGAGDVFVIGEKLVSDNNK